MHYFVAEDLTDSGRTAAGGDRKELGGSKQEGRCGWVKLITVMLDLIRGSGGMPDSYMYKHLIG